MRIVLKLLPYKTSMGLKEAMAGLSEMPPIRGVVGFQEVVSKSKRSTWVSLGVPWRV